MRVKWRRGYHSAKEETMYICTSIRLLTDRDQIPITTRKNEEQRNTSTQAQTE
jgi:hypothetical protein